MAECECGCGGFALKRFVNGHNTRLMPPEEMMALRKEKRGY